MSIRINDPSCLKPRLLGRRKPMSSRIEGVLTRGSDEQALFVDAIDFDGERCRYRALENDLEWHTEQDGDNFQSYSQTIMDRLRSMDKDPDVELSIVDSAMTDKGDLMVAIRSESGGYCRWMPLPGASRADRAS